MPQEISWGTLAPYDLIKAFSDELERLAPFSYRELVHEAQEALETFELGEDVESTHYIIDDLMDALNHIAFLHGCYFGASDGDGSSFGFWLIDDETVEA